MLQWLLMEVRHYTTASGQDIFAEWIATLKDRRAKARVVARINRLIGGNFGDHKSVGEGVWELRIDYGPGYRLYYGFIDRVCVLLLCGGDKRTQSGDIKAAIEYFDDYK